MRLLCRALVANVAFLMALLGVSFAPVAAEATSPGVSASQSSTSTTNITSTSESTSTSTSTQTTSTPTATSTTTTTKKTTVSKPVITPFKARSKAPVISAAVIAILLVGGLIFAHLRHDGNRG